jgi:hypothetical protein
LNLIWANKPGCTRAVAEIWIKEEHLWFTLFIDDNDGNLKIEVLRPLHQVGTFQLDLAEAASIIDTAKRGLLEMLHSSS